MLTFNHIGHISLGSSVFFGLFGLTPENGVAAGGIAGRSVDRGARCKSCALSPPPPPGQRVAAGRRGFEFARVFRWWRMQSHANLSLRGIPS